MIIGDIVATRSYPIVQIPLWDPLDGNGHTDFPFSPIDSPYSPSVNINGVNACDYFNDFSVTTHRYFPSNENTVLSAAEFDLLSDSESDLDAFSCNYFRMYDFKIRQCVRGRSHDWTECPYAHHGEKARRRDPRKFHYSGTPCREFRKGISSRGDLCKFAHGVFECWLHPTRYRTQPCKDGVSCTRKICFFAHTADQLCFLPPQQQLRSPTSILSSRHFFHGSESPPLSPSRGCHFNSVNELANSVRRMQLTGSTHCGSMLRHRLGVSQLEMWKNLFEDEHVMERVESGRDLRTKIYAKLSQEIAGLS